MKHIGAPYESVGAGLFKDLTLMGIFPLPPPHVASVNMISVKFDPWVIPSPDLVDTWGDVMPLSPIEVNYCEIASTSTNESEHATSNMHFDAYSQGNPGASGVGVCIRDHEENVVEMLACKILIGTNNSTEALVLLFGVELVTPKQAR